MLPAKLSNGVLASSIRGSFQKLIASSVLRQQVRRTHDVEKPIDGSCVGCGNELLQDDPFCNPKNPVKVQFSDISAAAYNIRGGVRRTPCTRSNQLSKLLGIDLFLKKEYLQATGSFKERGARYAMLRIPEFERPKGVIAASAGNHALALCHHGQQLGIPVTVVMPVFAPLMKISCCRAYGANVIVKGRNIQESKGHALQLGAEQGMRYINGYDHPDVVAGQGTIGLEILDQVNDLDAAVIPIGGGGLIAGMALALKTLRPEIKIIGVEAETCPSFQNALTKGHLVPTSCGSGSLADGLAVPTVGCNALETVKGLIDQMVTVDEQSIALAILRLIEMEKAIVEGAGAVGLAALMSGKLPELQNKRVINILSGGNIDTTVLGRIIERGLAIDGRLIRFDVLVSDRPGGVAQLTTVIAELGASIKYIFNERAWVTTDMFSVRCKIVAEARDAEHVKEIEAGLRKRYNQVNFKFI
ncbi:hypothetical protein L596_019907 [Steinernema carpocapsae]|uniref:L-serine deaminase n=1 Tax=Steinernema carpocapsae TaxID=34508 RepID=A0A4U5MS24_STECR|nr:hypothetical protein L596_019907 [Steinernema carpocapsae]